MKMTQTQFELIARAVRDAKVDMLAKEPDECHRDLIDGACYVSEFLADALAPTNPRFDRAKFLAQCGVVS